MARIRTVPVGPHRGEDDDAAPAATGEAPPEVDADDGQGPGGPPEGTAGADSTDEAVPGLPEESDDVDEIRLADDTADEDRAARLKAVRDANLAKGRQAGRKRKTLGGRPGRPRRVVASGDEPPRAAPKANGITTADVSFLLTVVEGLTVPALGQESRFTEDERKLIVPSLGRIMSRMSPAGAAVFTAFSDPIMLGTGLLIWWLRVSRLSNRPGPPQGVRTGPYVPSGAVPANGVGAAPVAPHPRAEDVPHVPTVPPDPNGAAHPDGIVLGGL